MATTRRAIPDAEVEEYIALVYAAGMSRLKTQGPDFDLPNYLAGALVWLIQNGLDQKIPASWFFNTMRGEVPWDSDHAKALVKKHKKLNPKLFAQFKD